jgi:uncharacterized protein
MERRIRILAASDIHGNSERIERLAQKAEKEKVDVVLLCGDILGFVESKNIIAPFKRRNKPVLVIPGNHEQFSQIDFMAEYYKIKNLHGTSAIYNGIGIFGAGGADLHPGFISESQLAKLLDKAHNHLKGVEKKILMTHMHPADSKSEFSGIPGSLAIKKAIEKFKPDLVLHGHIHEGEGLEEIWGNTKIVNVGREGRIFEL